LLDGNIISSLETFYVVDVEFGKQQESSLNGTCTDNEGDITYNAGDITEIVLAKCVYNGSMASESATSTTDIVEPLVSLSDWVNVVQNDDFSWMNTAHLRDVYTKLKGLIGGAWEEGYIFFYAKNRCDQDYLRALDNLFKKTLKKKLFVNFIFIDAYSDLVQKFVHTIFSDKSKAFCINLELANLAKYMKLNGKGDGYEARCFEIFPQPEQWNHKCPQDVHKLTLVLGCARWIACYDNTQVHVLDVDDDDDEDDYKLAASESAKSKTSSSRKTTQPAAKALPAKTTSKPTREAAKAASAKLASTLSDDDLDFSDDDDKSEEEEKPASKSKAKGRASATTTATRTTGSKRKSASESTKTAARGKAKSTLSDSDESDVDDDIKVIGVVNGKGWGTANSQSEVNKRERR
jgi:hypothetical protein